MKKYILPVLAALTLVSSGALADRRLVITDTNGKTTEFNASDIQGITFEDAPLYTEAAMVPYTRYEERNGLGFYTVELATAADEYGMPLEPGDIMLSLELTGPTTANLDAPELAPGYYLPGNGKSPFTFDVAKSVIYTRYEDGAEGITATPMLDGTVDVRCEDGVYDIRVEVMSFGGPVYMRYIGEVPFGRGIGEAGEFTEDIDLTFMGAQGRFYGNWFYPFAADLTTDFFTGTIADGVMTSGYVLRIDYCEPKPEDCMNPDQRVADGTYSVETRDKIVNSMYLPYRFNAGSVVDFMGTEYITGTRLEYYDETGHRKMAMITDGSFTVSMGGSRFNFDLVAENGIHITGSYAGIPALTNYCDNDVKEPLRPYSTLTEDVTLEWAPRTFAFSYMDEEAEIVDGMYNVFLCIADENMLEGDYLMFNIISESPKVEDGLYEVNFSLEPDTMIPGCVDFGGNLEFSWYGDLSSTDEEGVQSVLAAIESGTMRVTTLCYDDHQSERKFEFNLVADDGHTIKGEFTGEYEDLNELIYGAPAKKSPRQMRKKASRALRAQPRR